MGYIFKPNIQGLLYKLFFSEQWMFLSGYQVADRKLSRLRWKYKKGSHKIKICTYYFKELYF